MSDVIDLLLARSSLGTSSALALRKRATPEPMQRILREARARESVREIFPRAGHIPMESSTSYRAPTSGGQTYMLQPGQFLIQSVRLVGMGGLGTVDEVEVIASNESHPVGTRLARNRLGPKWANDPGAQARFEREIEMLGAMRHPHIVSLAGVSLPGGERWYVMPLFPRSLRGATQHSTFLPNAVDATRFVAKIADALSYAHSLHFIHRDLKPENVLLDGADDPIVADWGLGQFVHLHSKVLDLTRGGPMGTSYYCSLEQWATGRCEITGDVYSLGVMLAELIAKKPLPIQPIGSGIREDVLPSSNVVSRAINAIVRRMTMLAPGTRPQSMSEVARALRSAGQNPVPSQLRW